jgi:23S rRNA pseudouridine1911/1915/1917 synthase
MEKVVEKMAARLDAWLAEAVPDHSRSRWQALILEGQVTVNGEASKANRKLRVGDRVEWVLPAPVEAQPQPEDIPLQILHEDRDILVLNKPAGLVVHPAAGNETGTLVNALLHHCTDLAGIGGEKRPGIVHRLDKETSGVLVVAKNEKAMVSLSAQFKAHETEKEYLALVRGVPTLRRGTVEVPIGRHPVHRKKMAANVRNGRSAVSHYEVIEVFEDAALLRVRIETGRTHQIRVHLAYLKHPVIGDDVYGRACKIKAPRHMLHAARLALTHPRTRRRMTFEAPVPEEMQAVLDRLRAEKAPARA